MFDRIFKKRLARERMAASHLSITFEPFTQALLERGHVLQTIQMYVQAVEHFGQWLRSRKIPMREIQDEQVRAFLRDHLPRCRCNAPAVKSLKTCRAALGRFMSFLRQSRLIPEERIHFRALTLHDSLITRYDRHLANVAGLAPWTRWARARYAREFLHWRFRRRPIRLKAIEAADLSDYVALRSKQLKPGSVRALAVSLRSLARFLDFSGDTRKPLATAIPRFAPVPQSPPTRLLNCEQRKRFIHSFDRRKPTGQRDFAIGLCLLELGLRASEASALQLEDLDWNQMTLRLGQTKQRRVRVLPIPSAVALALADYLRNGRPQSPHRSVFLRHRAPLGDPLKPHHVHSLVRRAFVRVGLIPTGTHTLRHTWATEAQRRGVPLKSVADILGHTCLNTTNRYTHVNLEELRQAALPWPTEIP